MWLGLSIYGSKWDSVMIIVLSPTGFLVLKYNHVIFFNKQKNTVNGHSFMIVTVKGPLLIIDIEVSTVPGVTCII